MIGKAQMHLDDAAADRLQVDHASVAGEMAAAPIARPSFDGVCRFSAHFPVVERAVARGDAGGMPPPLRGAVDQRDVAAEMLALEQFDPHVTRPIGGLVVGFGTQHAAADTHAFQVVDRLGEHGIFFGCHAVRRC